MVSLEIDNLIKSFVEQSKNILKDNLVGVYLHGSLSMGCFNPQRSDIDLIIVVNKPLSDDIKKEYLKMVVDHNERGPIKGIEMSIVLKEVCKPFIYPTPFELHFSIGHLDWYEDDPEEYIQEMKGVDKDLAAHFTIIGKRGKCLYGPSIKDLFAEVPSSDYMDSIWFDIENATKEITMIGRMIVPLVSDNQRVPSLAFSNNPIFSSILLIPYLGWKTKYHRRPRAAELSTQGR